MLRETFRGGVTALLVYALMVSGASAEFDCFPTGKGVADLAHAADPYFATATSVYAKMTAGRYLEGVSPCADVTVPGYEGYPTKLCRYASADWGKGHFQPINAQVVLLDPSSAQLADWTIEACQRVGVKDAKMEACIKTLADSVSNDGAQFPVIGSVVESICASSGGPSCQDIMKISKSSPELAPRNTLYRNGVPVWTKLSKWAPFDLSNETYAKLLNPAVSDPQIYRWQLHSRVSNAVREDWINWRSSTGASVEPEGVAGKFDIWTAGWGTVSMVVHKTACAGGPNELFDAYAYTRRKSLLQ